MKKDVSTVEVDFTDQEVEQLKHALESYKRIYNKVKHIQNPDNYYEICVKNSLQYGICYFLSSQFSKTITNIKLQKMLGISHYLCPSIYLCILRLYSLKQRNDTFRIRIKVLEKILKRYE